MEVAVHQGIRTGLAWLTSTASFEIVNSYNAAIPISAPPNYTSGKITHTQVNTRLRHLELDSKDLPSK